MLIIWRFTDGKRGHENQSLGLVEALARLSECRVETVPVTQAWPYAFNWLAGRFPEGKKLPKPDLILGAGHATHWPMLAARRAHGGKIAVLMKPSLPLSWFDWVIAPEHDFPDKPHPLLGGTLNNSTNDSSPTCGGGWEGETAMSKQAPGANTPHPNPPRSREGRINQHLPSLHPSREMGHVLPTIGPLNRIRPSANKIEDAGLMLIGGATKEYGWSETGLLKQIHLIALHHADIRWQLTTSRRTPASFLQNLARLKLPNLEAFAHDALPPDWLPTQLAASAQVWVTPDSASMVYEALSSGASVGCFELPFAKPGRVARGLEKLLNEKRLCRYGDWQAAGNLPPNLIPLNESERCAKELLQCLKKN